MSDVTGPKIGELFAGYGGLGMGVQAVLGGDIAWVSDVCKFDKDGNAGHYEPHRGPCRILAHRLPGVPNLGDVTKVDWSNVEPVDVLTGGSPCQDLSHAGKRQGMTEGTRSNLWVSMREAIAQLRPSLVIWENVRGAYSAEASSELGSDPRLLGRARVRDGQPVLRALGRVLGDLSDLGYDAGWHGLRAADVGAAHGRFRVFVVATDTRHAANDWERARPQSGKGGPAATYTADLGHERSRRARDWRTGPADSGVVATEGLALLPTPAVNDMDASYTPETWDAWTAKMQAEHGKGNGRSAAGTERRAETGFGDLTGSVLHGRWGDYAAAIARWETVTGRPAPPPTMTSTKGNPQLSPVFVEWLMGLPAGWVTDVPGITRNEALKALGNGVVPQQATAAIRWLEGALARVG